MIFVIHTRLHGTLQIMLQIEVLFTVQKLARFRKTRVNESGTVQVFLRSKICLDPSKLGHRQQFFHKQIVLVK